jgi:hypothetical protein
VRWRSKSSVELESTEVSRTKHSRLPISSGADPAFAIPIFSDDDSQEKASSDLHLMLVFFDVLEMDGEAMIWKSYGERRKRLEEVVKIIPGFVSLLSTWMVFSWSRLTSCILSGPLDDAGRAVRAENASWDRRRGGSELPSSFFTPS